MSSPAQIAANRANAQFSTGPATEAGRTRSSLNALKTGLTGRTVLLPDEDADRYNRLVTGLFAEYQPAGDEESSLVQSVAEATWRLWRIPALEAAIYALGRVQFKDCFTQEPDPEVRAHLIDAKIFLDYHRQLNNLSIQEARLRRHQEKDRKRLHELQENRRRQIRQHPAAAASHPSPNTATAGTSTEPELLVEEAAIGFVFSTAPQQTVTGAPQLTSIAVDAGLVLPTAA